MAAERGRPGSPPTVVHLVPHTHWDREWYLPFQRFRMRLVDLVDRVLDLMDADPRFPFTLDGQLSVVDDYLEVRPEAEERIRARVAEGRLAVGPWQVLLDEFLVSGETIFRNLELGWRRAEELGGRMAVAYLPDMFGHTAQMPQILQRAGIAHAAVWRGVPAAIDESAFRWVAPDGSAVRAEYLVHGYGGAAYVLKIPDRLSAKIELLDEELRAFFRGRPVLAMYGTDHSEPLPDVVELVERMNRSQDRYRVEIETLADYFRRLDGAEEALPTWEGELRSAARANMLMGVTSARIDVKAAAGRAERLLERYAEPLQALYGDEWPETFLDLAWDRVVANSAHDSICGCSADSVMDQVLVRYAEAEQIAAGLSERAAEAIARRAPRGSVAVVNPSPHPRSGLAELELPIPEAWEEVALALPDGTHAVTQEVRRNRPLLYTTEIPGHGIPTFFRRMHGRELFRRWLNGYEIDRVDGVRRLTFNVDDEEDPPWLDVDELKREIEAAARAAADETWKVRILARPRRTLVAAVPVPALGWTAVRPVPGAGRVESPVVTGSHEMGNGVLDVRVAADGTLTLSRDGTTVEGVGRLVDGGDFGDSYNYAPPAVETLVAVPEETAVEVRAAGPLRGELAVIRRYRWPVRVCDDGSARSPETELVSVTTAVELRAGEPFVRVKVAFDNPCSDHRLRIHVPLAGPVATSSAEGQFAVVERGLEAEGTHGEVPLPTFPARGFVDAGGVAILLDHVMEYELVEGKELALTILRSTGLISRNANPYREEPAGPETPTPNAQCRGPWSVSFAIYPHRGSWSESGVLEEMERYRHPFVAAPGTAADGGGETAAGLAVEPEGVALSSLRRRGDWLELRLVCEQAEGRTAVVSGHFREARQADVFGRPGPPLTVEAGRLDLDLGPWEIRTVQLRS